MKLLRRYKTGEITAKVVKRGENKEREISKTKVEMMAREDVGSMCSVPVYRTYYLN